VNPGAPAPFLAVASILGRGASEVCAAVEAFSARFGRLCYVSDRLSFPWTDHYRHELGENPVRQILALEQPVDPSTLATAKRTTCRLEVTLGRPGEPRSVNIDPGALNEHQLVLASTKPRAHRIYLGQGIYGDLMLLHQGGRFTALPWTYPDYADDEVRGIFDRLRSLLLSRRRLAGGRENQ
jgi:hypothetical protein